MREIRRRLQSIGLLTVLAGAGALGFAGLQLLLPSLLLRLDVGMELDGVRAERQAGAGEGRFVQVHRR